VLGGDWGVGNEKAAISVIPQGFLELGQIPSLMRSGDGPHAIDILHLCVFHGQLDREQRSYVFRLRPVPINTTFLDKMID
jgi:hypothetical protein